MSVDGPLPPRAPFGRPLFELLPPPGELGVGPPAPPRYLLAAVLFVLSFLTTTTLGAAWTLFARTDVQTDLLPLLTPRTVAQVWGNPAVLALGLAFSLPALGILLCHELGHYLACRHYGLPSTLPYFLPSPVGIGTFGAFIRIRAPIRGKRELFDVGVAGPIAGFAALVPVLLWGVAHSRVARVVADPVHGQAVLLVPGHSLAIELALRLFHRPLGAGEILDLHPAALAAWFGLLATAINLLPLGQLDGGHILYAAVGRLQRRIALPLWLALGVAGFYWQGWLVWCVITLVMGLRHPPVRDESEPLDPKRWALAGLALLLLVLSFMPVPITELIVREQTVGATHASPLRAPPR